MFVPGISFRFQLVSSAVELSLGYACAMLVAFRWLPVVKGYLVVAAAFVVHFQRESACAESWVAFLEAGCMDATCVMRCLSILLRRSSFKWSGRGLFPHCFPSASLQVVW